MVSQIDNKTDFDNDNGIDTNKFNLSVIILSILPSIFISYKLLSAINNYLTDLNEWNSPYLVTPFLYIVSKVIIFITLTILIIFGFTFLYNLIKKSTRLNKLRYLLIILIILIPFSTSHEENKVIEANILIYVDKNKPAERWGILEKNYYISYFDVKLFKFTNKEKASTNKGLQEEINSPQIFKMCVEQDDEKSFSIEVEGKNKNDVASYCWLTTNQSHNLSLSNGNYKLKQGIYTITSFEVINKKENSK